MKGDKSHVTVTRGRFAAIAAAAVTAALLAPASVRSQTTCTVTTPGDTGPGTLRAHLANPVCAVIDFGFSGSIGILSPLTINRDVTIKGWLSSPERNLYPTQFTLIQAARVFEVTQGATVVISGIAFYRNRAPLAGGAIVNSGNLTVTYSDFVDNEVTPAIDPELGVDRSIGGAIYNTSSGSLTVTHSWFAFNVSDQGSAIYNNGTLTVINSTFFQNASRGGMAGTIFNAGHLTLTNSTINDNLGYGLWLSQGSLRSKNSIVAGNDGGDCLSVEASLSIEGVNLATDATCPQFRRVTPTELGLDADPPVTALLDGSVAIDAVADCTLHDGETPVATDGRGFARPQGAFCDVGAFEFVRPFTVAGPFAPLDIDALHVVKAGQAVAVKFSLGGDRGLGVLVPGFPSSQETDCDVSSFSNVIDETAAAGNSGLSYDLSTDTYTYVWKTERAWRDTCRQLTLMFADGRWLNGSALRANFSFK